VWGTLIPVRYNIICTTTTTTTLNNPDCEISTVLVIQTRTQTSTQSGPVRSGLV